jgi:hypothetical protein
VLDCRVELGIRGPGSACGTARLGRYRHRDNIAYAGHMVLAEWESLAKAKRLSARLLVLLYIVRFL